ncbi:hypothetical protein B0H13DRAFT_1113386 [Mycena leptocephala]|nr:hypothetical protein B0H13DRAFT_1113386 [Mycena leptocephala]
MDAIRIVFAARARTTVAHPFWLIALGFPCFCLEISPECGDSHTSRTLVSPQTLWLLSGSPPWDVFLVALDLCSLRLGGIGDMSAHVYLRSPDRPCGNCDSRSSSLAFGFCEICSV